MNRVGLFVLIFALIGTITWGYSERYKKEEIFLQAENNYQRSFHDLAYHMDMLHDTIGTTLALNSNEKLSPQMIEIWRLTSEAQSNIGHLPLGLLPFNKMEEFLSVIGDFSYKTAVRDLDETPLDEKETKTLESLYEEAGEIKEELRKIQHYVLKENLRWTEIELALAKGDEPKDNTIVDGFKTVEKKVAAFNEAHNNDGVLPIANKEHDFKYLKGKKISSEEAIEKAKQFVTYDLNSSLEITSSEKGANVDTFMLTSKGKNLKTNIVLTKIGGHPLTVMVDRPVGEAKFSLNDGESIAKQYLKDLNFDNMKLSQTNQFDNVGLYSFIYKDDDTYVYSDALEVKVALDKGEVIGLTARDYFMNHHDRKIEKPKLTENKARKRVNSKLEIEKQNLAIIDNEFGEETLVYEFIGTMNNDTYRIFINAHDGHEEKVERLTGTEILIS